MPAPCVAGARPVRARAGRPAAPALGLGLGPAARARRGPGRRGGPRLLLARAEEGEPTDAPSSSAAGGATQEVLLGAKGNAQLLGMKGADLEDDKWKLRLQLMKPVTWVPLIWGVACGAAASGAYTWTPENVAKALVCMVLSGPFMTGFTQVINDYMDRELDAINEPYRPIPSGRITEEEAVAQCLVLLFGSWLIAFCLDQWADHQYPIVFYEAVLGSVIAYIYSAPPFKLKANGWLGCYSLGASYIALPWWAGQNLFGANLTWDVALLTVLYSIAGLGIAIVNDFKSVEGDRALGMQSLPVIFGIEKAKYICAGTIDVTQFAVGAYVAFGLDEPIYGAVIAALVVPQIVGQVRYLIPDPVANDVKYQASAQPFLVLGILATGLAVGHHNVLIGNVPGL